MVQRSYVPAMSRSRVRVEDLLGRTGSLWERTGGRGSRVSRTTPIFLWLLVQSYAPATFAAIHDGRNLWNAAKFHQYFPKARAIFHVHIDKFKGHGLWTRAAHDGLTLNIAHAVRDLQREERAGGEMAFTGADSAAKVELRNGKPKVFAQVGGD